MTKAPEPKRQLKLVVFLPAIIFGVIAFAALGQLLSGRDLAAVPSALIGKPAPVIQLEALGAMPLFSSPAKNKVAIVNVWASWCAPCRAEHPVLLILANDPRLDLVGINYKDRPENALAFLAELGNPFDAIGKDPNGRAAIEWGVYGVPETFIVGKDGLIKHKHVGPLNADDLAGAFGKALDLAAKE